MTSLWTPKADLTRIDELIRERRGDAAYIHGLVHAEMRDAKGRLIAECVESNIITNIGDQVYAENGCGIGSPAAKPTGAKLGTGSTAVAKLGAGAYIVTYLTGSQHTIAGGYPTSTLNAAKRDIVYQYVWAAGEATTGSAITEASIVNQSALADNQGTEAQSLSRVILAGIGSKGASDTLTLTWTHTIGT